MQALEEEDLHTPRHQQQQQQSSNGWPDSRKAARLPGSGSAHGHWDRYQTPGSLRLSPQAA